MDYVELKRRKGTRQIKKFCQIYFQLKNSSKFPDCTEPKHLKPADWPNLKIIKKYYVEENYEEAMSHAMYNVVIVIREEISPNDGLRLAEH